MVFVVKKNQIKSLVAQYNTFIQPRVSNRKKAQSQRENNFFITNTKPKCMTAKYCK